MALVTNMSKITPIGLPGGPLIAPGASEQVDHWDQVKNRKNVAFYVERGVLVAKSSEGGSADGYTREQLVARLVELGTTPGPTSKDETLRKKLAELLTAKLKELGVPVADEGVSLAELDAAYTTAITKADS
ncbi:hypothetical protein PSm6_44610 [Pseudomonas solani]|uniref:Uncharacterized protein n=1 Tax=Pseudomonas solani TaxID=2731552 RepID=A0ABN6BZW2_9PSED|nr:hypothetical protein [Pseudomonas solani]BCD88054.1 hypothetical protein PSm6_44610 [Pseudomonas solani]